MVEFVLKKNLFDFNSKIEKLNKFRHSDWYQISTTIVCNKITEGDSFTLVI